jgi:hypothetical protein
MIPCAPARGGAGAGGRALATIACLAVAPLALAACGDDDDTSDASVDTAAASVAESAPATSAPTLATTPTTIGAASTVTTAPSLTSPEAPTTTPPTAPATSTTPVPSPDEVLAQLTDAQIAEIGGIECATEVAIAVSAAQRFVNERGTPPASLDDLVEGGFVDRPFVLWEVRDDRLVPLPGSGCVDVLALEQCRADVEQLTLARLAFLETTPGAPEPTQAELVAQNLVGAVSEVVDFVDGAPTAVPGGRCEGLDLAVDWEHVCGSETKTMEVAYEAYLAQNGADASPTEQDLAGVFIRRISPVVDLVEGVVVPVPGGPCEGVELT